MSLTRIVEFVIGLILSVAGLVAVISSFHGLPASWVETLIGLGALIIGVYIMKGLPITI